MRCLQRKLSVFDGTLAHAPPKPSRRRMRQSLYCILNLFHLLIVLFTKACGSESNPGSNMPLCTFLASALIFLSHSLAVPKMLPYKGGKPCQVNIQEDHERSLCLK